MVLLSFGKGLGDIKLFEYKFLDFYKFLENSETLGDPL